MDGGRDRIIGQLEQRLEAVRVTWVEVEAAASRYGVRVPTPAGP